MPDTLFGTFKIELQNTLNNLFNPLYEPAAVVLEVTSCLAVQGLVCVRGRIVDAIRSMHLENDSPPATKSRLIHGVLEYHFVQALSQEKTAEILGISARHLRRLQQEAIYALALHLWTKRFGAAGENVQEIGGDAKLEIDTTWRDAFLHEIGLLQAKFPGVSSNLQDVFQKVREMAGYLVEESSLRIEILPVEDHLEIPIHPNILRQVILNVIEQFSQNSSIQTVEIAARSENEQVIVSFSTCQPEGLFAVDFSMSEDLMKELGAEAKVRLAPERCSLELVFARAQKIKVLVIDDNPDVVRLYRRYTANTRYEIAHLSSGDNLLGQIDLQKPNIIVMDILLPGFDGWDLLMQLNNFHLTRKVPVVICSVMGNEHVARSLGASFYIPKPVEKKAFLEALDQLTSPSM